MFIKRIIVNFALLGLGKMDYQNYIFDLDGTLLDTLYDLTMSTNYALRRYNLPEHSIDEVREFVGNGVKKLMERAIPQGMENPLFDVTYACFRKHYLAHNLDNTAPYKGIIPMLAELKKRGKKMAVVSNKFYTATQDLCRHFFSEYIDVAIGERENIRKKPAPDTVLEALWKLGVDKKNTVYIGDSDVDIQTAKNCGIPCISVLWGFRSFEFLVNHGATQFIESPDEILL